MAGGGFVGREERGGGACGWMGHGSFRGESGRWSVDVDELVEVEEDAGEFVGPVIGEEAGGDGGFLRGGVALEGELPCGADGGGSVFVV